MPFIGHSTTFFLLTLNVKNLHELAIVTFEFLLKDRRTRRRRGCQGRGRPHLRGASPVHQKDMQHSARQNQAHRRWTFSRQGMCDFASYISY